MRSNVLRFGEFINEGFSGEKSLLATYSDRANNVLPQIAEAIERDLREVFSGVRHVDRIATRAKSIDSFMAKAGKFVGRKRKYSDPIVQIQDQIGARVIVFYTDDVDGVARKVLKRYKAIEDDTQVPDGDMEFGYSGRHFVFVIPKEFIPEGTDRERVPKYFELQIKTLFQHAYSEAAHDIHYKPRKELTSDHKRRVAFAAAQGWGADRMFNELKDELEK